MIFMPTLNCPADPNGGIAASLGQEAGYKAEIIIAPQEAVN